MDTLEFTPGEPVKLSNGLVTNEHGWLRYMTFREMTGVEEDLLSDRQLHRRGTTIEEVLKNCVTAIGNEDNPTLIEDRNALVELLPKFQLADSSLMLLHLRQVSLGSIFKYKARCEDQNCRETNQYTFDLSTMGVTYREEEPVPQYRISFGDSRTAQIKLLTLLDNPKLVRTRRDNPERELTMKLFLQLTELDGKNVSSYHEVQKMSSRQRSSLREAIRKEEYGVDMMVTNACKYCGHEWDMMLPVGTTDFFFPSETRD